ncbi:ATP phosphoribosyltransferase regulatory subunit, partial [Flavobacteriaceae bacterium]|nr:ATP phosphoribosyltransferase regulatory subunit [Flavobacteriaceae bacterium]
EHLTENNSISNLSEILSQEKNNIHHFDKLFQNISHAKKGIEELQTILEFICQSSSFKNEIRFDITLARGLNYYTGTIVEVISKSDTKIGSLGGGGRYDDLTSLFNFKNASGVGISFGLDRIYLLMEEQNLFPKHIDKSFDIIIINFGLKYLKKLYPLIDSLRKNGKKINIYPDNVKLNKQFSYANKHKVINAIIMGENEFKKNQIIIKNMVDGTQSEYLLSEVNSKLF